MQKKIVLVAVLAIFALGLFYAFEAFSKQADLSDVQVEDLPLEAVEEPKVEPQIMAQPLDALKSKTGNQKVPAQVGPQNQLMGTVTATNGQPIEGATLTLFQYEYVSPSRTGRLRNDHKEVVRESTQTNAEGRYLFKDLSDLDGPYLSMRVEKTGFSEVLKDAVGPGMIVDAKLDTGINLVARLVDSETGEPIPHVFCDISMFVPGNTKHAYRRWRRQFTSKADGTFELTGVPNEPLTLYFEHGEYQWLFIKATDPFWADADLSSELVLKMKPGIVLDGKVVDAVTKQPINKVSVTLREYIVPTRREITGVFGKFGFKGLNTGRFEMVMSARGYTETSTMLEVSRGSMDGELVYEMKPAGFASGVVVDQDGNPIPGADVYVAKGMDIFRNVRDDVEARADGQGVFTVDNLDDGKTYRIAVAAEGFCIGVSADFRAVAAEYVDGIIVQLSPGATLRGVVSDDDGVPIRDVVVTLEKPQFRDAWFLPNLGVGQKSTLTVTTNQNGFWEFTGLWPGQYGYSLGHPDYVPQAASQVRIDKTNDRIDQPVTLTRGKVIRGTVTNESGQPLAGVVVTGSIGKFRKRAVLTTTASDGTYALTQLMDQAYRVKAMAESGIAHVQEDVFAGSSSVDFVLLPYGSLDGAVVADQSSAPIDRFRIRVRPLHDLPRGADQLFDPNSRRSRRLMEINESYVDRTLVAPDGRFRIDNLEPGEYIVDMECENRVPARQFPVVVQPGSLTTLQTFILREGARLEGTIKDAQGLPIKHKAVQLRILPVRNAVKATVLGPDGKKAKAPAQSSWESRGISVDGDGRFKAAGLPPGKIRLDVSSSVYCCPASETITCGQDGVIRRDYTLVRGAKVVIHGKDLDGDPLKVPAAAVFNADGTTAKVDGRRVSVSVGMRGVMTIPKIEPGSYTIEVKHFGYRHERIDFQVIAGETKILNANLEKLR